MISLTQLVLLAFVVVACYIIGTVGFKWDDKIEDRRKAAGIIAGVLDRYGLKRLAEVFRCYSVGDYSGFIAEMAELAKTFLQSEDAVVKELDTIFDRVLTVKLANPESRAYLRARLSESEQVIAA
jgi:hypothetical protein